MTSVPRAPKPLPGARRPAGAPGASVIPFAKTSVQASLVALIALVAALAASSPAGARVSVPADAATGSGICAAGPCMITVTRNGSGRVTSSPAGIDCGTTCEAGFQEAEWVTLTPTHAPDEKFLGWDGCPTPGTTQCRFQMAVWVCVTANFTGSGSSPPACADPNDPGTTPPVSEPRADHPALGSRCTIPGSRRGDVIRGTPGDDVICGRAGDDVIYGRGGNDLILGDGGTDRLFGGPGREHLLGGFGDDVLDGGGSDDELFGGPGLDVLRSRDGIADLVNGGPGRDRARVDVLDVLRAIERRL